MIDFGRLLKNGDTTDSGETYYKDCSQNKGNSTVILNNNICLRL